MQSDLYDVHHTFEDSHWWFTARRQIVMAVLERQLRLAPCVSGEALRIVDIGCGPGGMLSCLGALGSVTGVDPAPGAVAHARDRGHDARVGGLPSDLPFRRGETFHLATMLDVLEHVEDDAAALRAVRELLVPGGRLLMTVPAGQHLWSSHDVANDHFRRYRRRDVLSLLQRSGFKVELLSYYNSALYVPIAAVRLVQRLRRERPAVHDFRMPSRVVNRVLHEVFAAERVLLGRVNLPIGVSLIGMAVRAQEA